ncbi:hypothetical protein HY933_01495 [Candidatus Falkowbacteria bacterium]|nr:hypothetical protein [Candidatus Falkowbacteria bacterium]
MRLSILQKYILRQCYLEGKKLNRSRLTAFYSNQKVKPRGSDQVEIVTKSLERLIEKGLLVGYGVRTPRKWFIQEVRLTRPGQRAARELLGQQQKLKI